jgi:hypothetical protein
VSSPTGLLRTPLPWPRPHLRPHLPPILLHPRPSHHPPRLVHHGAPPQSAPCVHRVLGCSLSLTLLAPPCACHAPKCGGDSRLVAFPGAHCCGGCRCEEEGGGGAGVGDLSPAPAAVEAGSGAGEAWGAGCGSGEEAARSGEEGAMACACSTKRWHKCRTDPSPPPRPPSSSGLHTRRTLSSFASGCKVCNFGAGFRAWERGGG